MTADRPGPIAVFYDEEHFILGSHGRFTDTEHAYRHAVSALACPADVAIDPLYRLSACLPGDHIVEVRIIDGNRPPRVVRRDMHRNQILFPLVLTDDEVVREAARMLTRRSSPVPAVDVLAGLLSYTHRSPVSAAA